MKILFTVLQALLVQLVHQPDKQVQLVQQVFKVLKVLLAGQALKVGQDLLDLKVIKDFKDLLAQQDHKVIKVIKV